VTIYLGPVGNLIALPSIGRGISAALTVPSAVHQIAGRGGRVIDRFPGAAARTYQMARSWLTADEVTILEAMYLGAYGSGPFVLFDPWRRNMLSANQSSGTDVLDDTTGFVPTNTAILSSSTVLAEHGQRSLAWAVTAISMPVITGLLTNEALADVTHDVPVVPSTAYTAQVRGRLSTSTGTIRPDLRWYDSAGAFISINSGTAVALVTGSWTTATVTATAPSNAALARFKLANTVMGAAQTIYLDKWQLEQASTAGAWVLGTGVPRVSFTDDLGESYNGPGFADAGFTLTEVGAS
jgi:hypothetical protein